MPGLDHGPSIKCPKIYDALRRKGMDKTKSARISNAMCAKMGRASEAAPLDLTPDDQSEIWRMVGLVWEELYPDEAVPDFARVAADTTCKNEGDACFKKGDYAYTPSDAPGSWKVRLTSTPGGDPDAQIVGAAIAALGKGFRGNKVDIPADALPGVTERVRQAWRKANPGKKDDEMPDAIVKKASEEQFDETRSPDYLAKMISWLQEQFGKRVDPEEYKAAHRSAMGHAGGKATARKRQEKVAASEVHAHESQHPEPVAGCTFCGDYYGSPMPPIVKMLKADDRVNYRPADTPDANAPAGTEVERCYDCRFYEWGACRLGEGSIEAGDVCDLYMDPVATVPDPQPSLYSAAEQGSAWALFNELPESFADVPDTVNVLPLPGVYEHPRYGTIIVTPERNARFVDNFNNRVYQQDLPITLDIEHSKMGGAVGEIVSLALNDNGSVDGKIKWSERGKTLIEEDAFKYFSPEWLESWRDPATGDEFDDVLIGGALTVRPWFKESALRPLVASELALYAPESGSDDEPMVFMLRPLVATEYVRETRTMGVELTEDEVKEFRELKATRTATEDQLRQANEKIEALETDRRRQRFTDIVRGRAEGSDGAVWVGPVNENVASLERLAVVFGEDSDQFKAEVAFRTDLAKQLKESGVFKANGSPEGETVDTSASAELNRRASEMVAAGGVARAEAVRKIFREDPDLYARYNRENTRKPDGDD